MTSLLTGTEDDGDVPKNHCHCWHMASAGTGWVGQTCQGAARMCLNDWNYVGFMLAREIHKVDQF